MHRAYADVYYMHVICAFRGRMAFVVCRLTLVLLALHVTWDVLRSVVSQGFDLHSAQRMHLQTEGHRCCSQKKKAKRRDVAKTR